MTVFKIILKIVLGGVCAILVYVFFNLGAQNFESNDLFASLLCYALGAGLAFVIILLVISLIRGLASGAREAINERREDSGSRRSSSSRYSSSGGSYSSSESYSDSSNGLKKPDGHVELSITQKIDYYLPSTTPSTSLSCNIYGRTAYLSGNITLWNGRDANKVQSAVRRGFLEAMREAAREGYDVGGINLSTSVSVHAADSN